MVEITERGHRQWSPDPAEIDEACRRIQLSWSHSERQRRIVGGADECVIAGTDRPTTPSDADLIRYALGGFG